MRQPAEVVMINSKDSAKPSTEAYVKLKGLIRRLRKSSANYSFVVAASGNNNCKVSVLSDDCSGMQQHVISMACANLSAQQAQALVSRYA